MHASTRASLSSGLSLATFGGLTAAAAFAGAQATRRSVPSRWYARLRKPPFQPPRQAFAPVWTALYALTAASGWRVARHPASLQRTQALGTWGLQLALNAGWSWLFFGLRRPRAALVEVGLLAAAVGAYAASAARVDRPAAWMVAPYLAWTGFAGLLNAELVRRNPRV